MKITGFLIMNDLGDRILADAFGDNLAFCCYECGHPILAIALENQRGSDKAHPVACPRCAERYFLDVRTWAEKIYVHQVDAPDEVWTR